MQIDFDGCLPFELKSNLSYLKIDSREQSLWDDT